MVIEQYAVYLTALDPSLGHKIKKTRPCVIISPQEMNLHIGTVIIAPMTTRSHAYPTRIAVHFQSKSGWIVLDQIRTIDKMRLIKKLGRIGSGAILRIKSAIREMLVD